MVDFITITKTGVQQVTSGVSAGGLLPTDSAGNVPRYIRVAATAPACFRMGKGAQVAVPTDLQIQPGDSEVLHVPQGVDQYAVIQVSGPGVVQISPLENL